MLPEDIIEHQTFTSNQGANLTTTTYFLAITPETIRGFVEILATLLMLFGLLAVVWHRLKQGLGLSNLSLQFAAVIFVFPTILILSLEKVLQGETAGTLIGTLAGYLFSEFGKNKLTTSSKPSGSTAASSDSGASPSTNASSTSSRPGFVDTQP